MYINFVIYFGKENYFAYGIFNKTKKLYAIFFVNFLIDLATMSLLLYSWVENENLMLDAFVGFDNILRFLMYINCFVELRFFKSQVFDWKKNFILTQTLY